MAVLKYKTRNGEYKTLLNYTIKNPHVVGTTGDSEIDVMSQKAVTEELKKFTPTENMDTLLANYVDNIVLPTSTDKNIYFKHGETEIAKIDTTDFVKDGMVEDVKVEGSNLVITFNTEAGKEDIELPLTDIFDPSNYMSKTEINQALYGSDEAPTPNAPTIVSVKDALDNNTPNFVKTVKVGETELTTTAGVATIPAASATQDGYMPMADKKFVDYESGFNTVNSVQNIPVDKKLCIVNVSGAQANITLAEMLEAGRELQVIINASAAAVIPIGKIYDAAGITTKSSIESLEIEDGKYGELNIISDGTTLYVRGI